MHDFIEQHRIRYKTINKFHRLDDIVSQINDINPSESEILVDRFIETGLNKLSSVKEVQK